MSAFDNAGAREDEDIVSRRKLKRLKEQGDRKQQRLDVTLASESEEKKGRLKMAAARQ